MKHRHILVLFSILLLLACIFASCNASKQMFTNDTTQTDESDYEASIKSLESKIVELQQDQYISEVERKKELTHLQNLLAELKEEYSQNSSKDDSSQNENDITNNNSGNNNNNNNNDNNDTNNDNNNDNEENDTIPTGKFLYNVDGEYATITGYTGSEERLVIPAMIDGYTVREIADSAFSSNQLKSIIITNGIEKIGWFAFQSCPTLIAITIPDSVSSIGYSAFPMQSKNFTIYCSNNSFAQQYAKSYGISYTVV